MIADHRDLALEDLADEEADVREQLAATRAVLSVALTRLLELHQAAARSQERIERLVDETRRLREALFSLDRPVTTEQTAA